MSTSNGPSRQHEETFKQAAVELLHKNGNSLKAVSAELGVEPAERRAWKRKLDARSKPGKSLSVMAQLRAENEALRNQIVSLQVQWDVLKTTLGVLSTTVCSHEII
jgi:transposase-like protein